ncbi:hypothetical protein IJT17_06935, partial [bacterium]|nr:hypothetical protein [bacterium]
MKNQPALEFTDMYATSPNLFGADCTPGLVGCSLDADGSCCTWWREGDATIMKREQFEAFVWLNDSKWAEGFEGEVRLQELRGSQPFRYLAWLPSFPEAVKFSRHVAAASGVSANSPDSPQIFISDGESQYLMQRGYTYFKGMKWADVRYLWICPLTERGPFVASLRDCLDVPLQGICLRFSHGPSHGLRVRLRRSDYKSERDLLKAMLEQISSYDPDVIAGHQLYDSIMAYLTARAKKCRLKLTLGRCDSVPSSRAVRQKIAEKNLDYRRYDLMGRELIDTWVLAQLYDVSARQMESYDLLEVSKVLFGENENGYLRASHWFLDGRDTGRLDDSEREMQVAEAMNDYSAAVTETLSQSYFLQAQIFPYTYQNAVTRGNATRINSLFLRAYLRAG